MPDKKMFQTKCKIKLFVKVALISFALFFFSSETSHALVSDAAFFNYLNLDYPGMGGVKSAVSANNYTLAKSELLKYYQNRPAYSASTPYGRSYWPLETTGNIAKADDNANHYFTLSGKRYFVGTNINWYTNPDTDGEWILQFNRHQWMPNFGSVYVQTGNEKYALEWIAEIKDWINDCLASYPGTTALGTALRVKSWVTSYQYFINKYDSPSITSDDNITMLKSLKEHADYLSTMDTPGNHGSTEQICLIIVSIMFPEFKSASSWLSTATPKLEGHLNVDFLADGVHIEMCPSYHWVALRDFISANEITQMNNISPFSSSYMTKVEKACEYAMFLTKPNTYTPALSDSGRNGNLLGALQSGISLFGRQDMLYVYTSGVSGTMPTVISKNYPNGGYTIMRSGWGTSANFSQQLYLVFDCGPLGGGHGHLDALNFEAYAYGKDLIVDPGTYTYDQTIIDGIDWRMYFKGTKAHNTIVVNNINQSSWTEYIVKSWVTNKGFDYVHGQIKLSGSNPIHDRKIFFVRNEYWIISDLLTGTGSHTYDQYFHIPKEGWGNTTMDATSKIVTCTGNNLKIIPADPTTFTSASIIDDWIETSYGYKTQSPTVKYTKSGPAPTTFDTILYPYPGSAPSVSVTRLIVNRGGAPISSSTAGGLRIDINSNRDYYFISHDNPIATTYGAFDFNGTVGYVRKNNPNVTVNIQLHDATELKENGVVLATVTGGKSDISSSNGRVEISGAITYFKVWAPSATSVKVNGVIVAFTQNGNYVESTGAPLPPPPPASCTNGIKDGDETSIDCGGTICPACAVPTPPTPPAEDKENPVITIDCPSGTPTYSSNIINFSGTATDDVAVSKVEYKIDSGAWQTLSGSVSPSWRIADLNIGVDGTHTVTFRATDTSNKTAEISIQVIYDSTVPATPACTKTVAQDGSGDFTTIQAAADVAAAGDVVCVKAGTYNEEINFPNSGIAGNYITFQNYSNDVVILKAPVKTYHAWDAVTPNHHSGNIEIIGKSYIKIKGFRFIKNGGSRPFSVISAETGAHHIIIDGNNFDDFDEDTAVIIGYFPTSGELGAWNIDFINNRIYRTKLNGDFNEIISVGRASDINISYNYFPHVEGMAIVTKDHVYDTIIRNNRIEGAYFNGMPRHSYSNYLAPAIYVGGWVHPSTNIKIYNNFVMNAESIGVGSECGGLTKDIYFYNNIIVNGYYGFDVPYWHGLYCFYWLDGIVDGTKIWYNDGAYGNYENIQFYNNIAYNDVKNQFRSQVSQSDIIFRNNIGFGTGAVSLPAGVIQDHNSWNLGITDPKFVNIASNDFHLQPTSPAKDAGSPTGAPAFDFDNGPRPWPAGGAFDIGAYEFGSPPGPSPSGNLPPTCAAPSATTCGNSLRDPGEFCEKTTNEGCTLNTQKCNSDCTACAPPPPPPSPCDGIVCSAPGSCQVGPGKCESTSSTTYVCKYPDDPQYCDLDGEVCTVDRCLSKDGGLTSSCVAGPDACGGLIPCGRMVDDPTTDIIESNPCSLCTLIYTVQLIIKFLIKIAIVVALIAIAFGGFLYISAAGSQEAIEKAKSIIKYAIIGFIVILVAWVIIDSVLATAGYIDPIGGEWYMMNC